MLRDAILIPDGITQEQLAMAMGVTRYSINQLVNDRRSVTAAMALRLAQATGTTPEFWLNLQRGVDLFRARGRLRNQLGRIKRIRKPADETALFYDVTE